MSTCVYRSNDEMKLAVSQSVSRLSDSAMWLKVRTIISMMTDSDDNSNTSADRQIVHLVVDIRVLIVLLVHYRPINDNSSETQRAGHSES